MPGAHLAVTRLVVRLASVAMWASLAGGMVLLGPRQAAAQSAADTATARRLASEGIELFHRGDFAGALDRLERAQALFDAPTHLLFIARAQSKLGRLVESSETYRRLTRVKLAPDAPQAFRDAVASAHQELSSLEPTLPLLTVLVEPRGAEGLALTIDGVSVATAILGVERPINPGEHIVEASAPGYAPARAQVTIEPSGKKTVELSLAPEAVPSGTPAPAPAVDRGARPREAPQAPDAEADKPLPFVGFDAGIRLLGLLPSGNIDQNRVMSDYYKAGFGAQLHLGARFPSLFRKFDVGLAGFYGHYTLAPGAELDDLGSRRGSVTNQVQAQEAGFLLRASSKRHRFGPFAELGLSLLHRIRETRDFDLAGEGACQESTKWGGTALTGMGGVHVPLNAWLNLSPFVGASFAQFTHQSFTSPASCPDSIGSFERNVAAGAQKPHTFLVLGVGGEVLIGKD